MSTNITYSSNELLKILKQYPTYDIFIMYQDNANNLNRKILNTVGTNEARKYGYNNIFYYNNDSLLNTVYMIPNIKHYHVTINNVEHKKHKTQKIKQYYISFMVQHIGKKEILKKTINFTPTNVNKTWCTDFIFHPKFKRYKSCIEPLLFIEEIKEKIINTFTPPKKGTSKIKSNITKLIDNEMKKYNDIITKEDLFNTLLYVFNTYRELLYYRIRDNKIVCSYHLYNKDIQINKWHQYISIKNNLTIKQLMNNRKSPYYTIKSPQHWTVNGCLLSIENNSLLDGNPISYVHSFNEMLQYTIDNYGMCDVDLMINRKDFNYIRMDKRPGYINLYPTNYYNKNQPDNIYPMCGQSTKKEYYEIPIPNNDDWININNPDKLEQEWNNKKPILIWRGSSTGCGITIETNNRLKLADMSVEWKTLHPNMIDIGITNFVKRIKINNKTIDYLQQKKYDYLFTDRMGAYEQSLNKYILNIEGNAAAYRYSYIFKTGSVVVNVKSDFYMWFEPLLRNAVDFIEVDMNDVNYEKIMYDTITKLRDDDEYAGKIASNGLKFWNKYINKQVIGEYWHYLAYCINQRFEN